MGLLLSSFTRFYDRQFYIRTKLSKNHVAKFKDMLQAFFSHEKHLVFGIPSVSQCGDNMGMSGAHLNELLKEETRISVSTPTTRSAISPFLRPKRA